MENNEKHFGIRLRMARTALGLSQRKMAKLMKRQPISVTRWENGIGSARCHDYGHLVEAGFSLDFLYGLAKHPWEYTREITLDKIKEALSD